MNTVPPRRGRVAVVGAGPAGMATALSVHQAGHDVTLLERYPQARPAGNILNLWPPPVRALGLLGVDIEDLGAPCYSEFRSVSGRVRVRVNLSDDVLAKYGGGFIGLLRPDLYERMLAALPPGVLRVNSDVQRIEQDEAGVRLHMADGEVITADVLVGADGIDSLVRRTLWGDTPKREHNLHIFGGFTLDGNAIEGAGQGLAVLHHSRTVQGSWTAIRSKGRDGFQWWVLSAYDAAQPFTGDLHAAATAMGAEFPHRCRSSSPPRRQRTCSAGCCATASHSSSGPKAAPPLSATPPTPPHRMPHTAPGWRPKTVTSSAGSWPASTYRTMRPSAPPWTPSRRRASRTQPARSSKRSFSARSSITRPRRCA